MEENQRSDLISVFKGYRGMSECPNGLDGTKGHIFKKPFKRHVFVKVVESLGLYTGDFNICMCCGCGLEEPPLMGGEMHREYGREETLRKMKGLNLEVLARDDGTIFGVYSWTLHQTAVFILENGEVKEQSKVGLRNEKGRATILTRKETWEKYRERKE